MVNVDGTVRTLPAWLWQRLYFPCHPTYGDPAIAPEVRAELWRVVRERADPSRCSPLEYLTVALSAAAAACIDERFRP